MNNIKQLYGKKLSATDGAIGHLKDVYFDDKTWVVRYLVAETGSWLSGKQVLLPPRVFEEFEHDDHALLVNLARTQIENCPSIESHRPVSRQYDAEYYHYYGWPVYWIGDGFGGLGGFSGAIRVRTSDRRRLGYNQRDDVHLRSTKAITGYHIKTPDGSIGRVSDFVFDAQNWRIGKLVVQTGHWYTGKEILVSPIAIERISYEQSMVFVNLATAELQRAAYPVDGGNLKRRFGVMQPTTAHELPSNAGPDNQDKSNAAF